MATTESSAVIRLINSVQATPILDSFHEPDPVAAPEAPPLQADFQTVMVRAPKRSRWLLYTLSAIVLLGGAIGAGYVIGQGGNLIDLGRDLLGLGGTAGQTAQPAATPQPALAQTDQAERRAQQAVPSILSGAQGAEGAAPAQQVAFDAAFDIIIQPAGAVVFLDGKELGPSPLRIGRLAPGAHTLEIQAPEGYESKTIPIDLISGERQVIRLSLDGGEAEAEAVVAEAVVEPPAAKRSFRTKRPARKATADNTRKPEKVSLRSRSKRAAKKAAKRAPKVTKSSGMGTLMVGSKPPCTIYIDGKNTGLTTPQRAIKVKAGKHKVMLVNKQHGIKATATVSVKAGQTKRVIKDMSSRL